MTNPSTSPVRRASVRARPRRLHLLLALAALVLPLAPASLAGAGAGAPDVAQAVASLPRSEPLLTFTVIDGDTISHGITTARTWDDALEGLGIVRGPLDRVEVVPSVLDLDRRMTLRIVRVELERVEREVELSQGVITLEDPDLLRGFAEVVRKGSSGLIITTKLVLLVDGEVEAELTVGRSTIRPAVDRIERVGTREVRGADVWDALARCESSGRWDAVRVVNADLSYHGGLQFDPRTWNAFRPEGFPDFASQATRDQQVRVARDVLEVQGWGAWPACSKRLGLR